MQSYLKNHLVRIKMEIQKIYGVYLKIFLNLMKTMRNKVKKINAIITVIKERRDQTIKIGHITKRKIIKLIL